MQDHVKNKFRITKKETSTPTEVFGQVRYTPKSEHIKTGSTFDFILTQMVAMPFPLAWVQPHNLIQLASLRRNGTLELKESSLQGKEGPRLSNS